MPRSRLGGLRGSTVQRCAWAKWTDTYAWVCIRVSVKKLLPRYLHRGLSSSTSTLLQLLRWETGRILICSNTLKKIQKISKINTINFENSRTLRSLYALLVPLQRPKHSTQTGRAQECMTIKPLPTEIDAWRLRMSTLGIIHCICKATCIQINLVCVTNIERHTNKSMNSQTTRKHISCIETKQKSWIHRQRIAKAHAQGTTTTTKYERRNRNKSSHTPTCNVDHTCEEVTK